MSSPHDRLYATKTGTTREFKKALAATFLPPEPTSEKELQALNKAATVTKLPDGPIIVRYAPAIKSQKQETTLTPPGIKRNPYGGFYCS